VVKNDTVSLWNYRLTYNCIHSSSSSLVGCL